MMKRLVAALLFLVPNVAWATCSSVPYTFTPNTLAQSGQVNANFAAVVSCANNIDASQITTGTLPVARGGTNNTSWTTGSVVFATASTQLGQDNANLFWDSTNHRLGIGTNSPATPLEVNGRTQVDGTDNSDSLLVYNTAKSHFFTVKPETASNTGVIGYWTGSSFGTLEEGGNFKVDGSISITGDYQISGSTVMNVAGNFTTLKDPTAFNAITMGNASSPANAYINNTHTFTNRASGFEMLIDSTGNVIAGTLNENNITTSGSATACMVSNIYVASVGLTLCASDARLKDVGVPVADGAAALVNQLKPVNFTWKAGVAGHPAADNADHIGFVAQDVQPIMPQCVNTNPDNFYSLDSNCLVAYIAKAVQEMNAKLAAHGIN